MFIHVQVGNKHTISLVMYQIVSINVYKWEFAKKYNIHLAGIEWEFQCSQSLDLVLGVNIH